MRLTRRYTFAPNGWFQATPSDGHSLWGTHFLTVGCPDEFHAIRVGFANIAPNPYVVPRIVACPSTTWHDYANPTGNGIPTPLTAVHGGADDDAIVAIPDAPQRLVVRPNRIDPSSGEVGIPEWSWTDWCAVRSVSPDPATGMHVLMIRHTVERNDGRPVTFTNGIFRGWSANPAIHGGYDYFCGGLKNGSDRTGFESTNTAVLPSNMMVNGSFIAAVQFLTRRQGIVGVTTGDSHHQGTGTSGSFNNYLAQTTIALRRATGDAIPLGWASCGVGGATSQQFFPYLQRLLRHVTPSFVVLPGWTANDPGPDGLADAVAVERFFARLLATAEHVRSVGAEAIWLTPFPRDGAFMDAPRLAAWQGMREAILTLAKSGEHVVDAASVLSARSDDTLSGTYRPGTSDDDIHPNDHGHALVAELLTPVIGKLLRSQLVSG